MNEGLLKYDKPCKRKFRHLTLLYGLPYFVVTSSLIVWYALTIGTDSDLTSTLVQNVFGALLFGAAVAVLIFDSKGVSVVDLMGEKRVRFEIIVAIAITILAIAFSIYENNYPVERVWREIDIVFYIAVLIVCYRKTKIFSKKRS